MQFMKQVLPRLSRPRSPKIDVLFNLNRGRERNSKLLVPLIPRELFSFSFSVKVVGGGGGEAFVGDAERLASNLSMVCEGCHSLNFPKSSGVLARVRYRLVAF